MSNFHPPDDIEELVAGKMVKTDTMGRPIKKGQPGIAAIRQNEVKRLSKCLKLRFVDNLAYPDIAKVLGVDHKTVERMCAPFRIIMENPEEIRQFKKHEPHILDGIRMLMAQGMIDKLTDSKMRKAMDLSRLTYGYGVLYDKARLERGESTANVHTLAELVKAAHTEIDVTNEGTDEEVSID